VLGWMEKLVKWIGFGGAYERFNLDGRFQVNPERNPWFGC
jgi:hypothetical protein